MFYDSYSSDSESSSNFSAATTTGTAGVVTGVEDAEGFTVTEDEGEDTLAGTLDGRLRFMYMYTIAAMTRMARITTSLWSSRVWSRPPLDEAAGGAEGVIGVGSICTTLYFASYPYYINEMT